MYISERGPPQPPQILGSEELSFATVNETRTLRLECNATGVPKPSVSWTVKFAEDVGRLQWKLCQLGGKHFWRLFYTHIPRLRPVVAVDGKCISHLFG